MADPARARKLAKRISQIVANAIEHEVKDPRLNGVTITDTKVTADLHDATVYYTVFGDKLDAAPDVTAVAMALTAATGVLRTKVGQGTGVRFTPTLTFVADTLPQTTKQVDDLLERARAADAEVAALAANAKHAGDADPYKAPREESEED